MASVVIRRLIHAAISLVGISFVVFALDQKDWSLVKDVGERMCTEDWQNGPVYIGDRFKPQGRIISPHESDACVASFCKSCHKRGTVSREYKRDWLISKSVDYESCKPILKIGVQVDIWLINKKHVCCASFALLHEHQKFYAKGN